MTFNHISAITRGTWAIQLEYAQSVLPLVAKMLAGETVDFGLTSEKPKIQNEPLPIFCAAPGVYGIGVGQNVQSVPNETIAVVDLVGPVFKYSGACTGPGSSDFAQLIGELAQAENITGIVLNIDSPGGQVAGTKLLADVIKQADAIKPVVAMINDGIAASAAMWIASASREIYTTKKSDAVGSIGVFTTLSDMTEHYKQKGISIREIYSRLSTDKNAIISEALAGNDEPLKDELDIIAQDFIDTIRTNRGDRISGDEWTTGKMFRAKQATKMGLIDGVLSFDQVIGRVQKLSVKNSVFMSNKSNQANETGGGVIATTGQAPTLVVAGIDHPAFQHIMVAAGIEAITVCDDGFAMDETAMNNLEQVLANQVGEIEAQGGQIISLQNRITELEGQDQAAEIARLNARVAELETLPPAGGFQQTTKDADDMGNDPMAKYRTSYDAEAAQIAAMK